jgi:hypothetical protein
MISIMRSSLAALAILALAAACTSDDQAAPTATGSATATPEVMASPSPTATATRSPTPSRTPTPIPSPTPRPTPTPLPPIPEHLRVQGLFTDPRPTEPDVVVQLGPPPPSPFPPHVEGITTLYDLETLEVRTFGPGTNGVFSPDSRWMVWEARDDPYEGLATIRLLDLMSGEIRDLGPGHLAGPPVLAGTHPPGVFSPDARHLLYRAIDDGSSILRVLDLGSGETRDLGPSAFVEGFIDSAHVALQFDNEILNIFTGVRTSPESTGFDWRKPGIAGRYELGGDVGPDPRSGEIRITLREHATGAEILSFDALTAGFAGANELLVLTSWTGASTNLFLLDIESRVATFIATASLRPLDDFFGGRAGDIWYSANSRWVVWTEDYCFGKDGATRVYDRSTGQLTEIDDDALPVLAITQNGLLAVGSWGATAFVDPAPLRYALVVVDGQADVSWSPDYRYASIGVQLNHGGGCGV